MFLMRKGIVFVVVFGLFEMIRKKKKRVMIASSGPSSASRSGWVQRRGPSHKGL